MDLTDLVWIDSAGFHCADFPTFQQWFIGKYQGVYGADVYLGSDSQDGQWLAIVIQSVFDACQLAQVAYNGNSPVSAQGVSLARLVKLNGLLKGIPTNSTVQLVLVGVNGTVISNGIATDALSQQWLLPASVTIPISGTITVTATAAQKGAVAALPNTITDIFTPTNGWQTVNNPAAAIAGNPVEEDGALRKRQAVSVSIPALTALEATMAAVKNVTGVSQAVGYENFTNSTDGNGLPPHSIAIVVEGGDSTAIAQAIQIKKTPGAQTYGTTSVALTDSQGMPITINFFIPTPATISANVTVNPGANWNTATKALIQAAMAAAISAYPIGGDIVLTQLYQAAYLYGTPQAGSFTVVSITLEKNTGGFSASDIPLLFNEIPVCATTNITVTP